MSNGRQGDSFDPKHLESRIATGIENWGDKTAGTSEETSIETHRRQEESLTIQLSERRIARDDNSDNMKETTPTNAKQGELCVPNVPKEKNSMEHRTATDREIRAQV